MLIGNELYYTLSKVSFNLDTNFLFPVGNIIAINIAVEAPIQYLVRLSSVHLILIIMNLGIT